MRWSSNDKRKRRTNGDGGAAKGRDDSLDVADPHDTLLEAAR